MRRVGDKVTTGSDNLGMGSLLIVTGPPGAGKSTLALALVERFEPSVLIEGDAFFAFLRRGAIAPWLPEAAEQNEVVIRAAAAAAGCYARGRFIAVYDGVVGPWFLPTFASATGLTSLHYAVLLPPVDNCVERVATRQGHGFTDDAATRKMHAEFARADIDLRHLVLDATTEPDALVQRIFDSMADGRFVYEPS